VITSAIFLSEGFTITSFFWTMAKSYGLSEGTSRAALLVTGAVVTLLGTTALTTALNPEGPFWFNDPM
jgi:hypothetical protein